MHRHRVLDSGAGKEEFLQCVENAAVATPDWTPGCVRGGYRRTFWVYHPATR